MSDPLRVSARGGAHKSPAHRPAHRLTCNIRTHLGSSDSGSISHFYLSLTFLLCVSRAKPTSYGPISSGFCRKRRGTTMVEVKFIISHRNNFLSSLDPSDHRTNIRPFILLIYKIAKPYAVLDFRSSSQRHNRRWLPARRPLDAAIFASSSRALCRVRCLTHSLVCGRVTKRLRS